jgi:hypothetical protein
MIVLQIRLDRNTAVALLGLLLWYLTHRQL